MSRKLIVSTVVTLIFVGVEVGVGLYANSLSVLGDALHSFTDCVALLIALVAVRLERKPPTEAKSFGYQRAGILAAFINAGMLVAFTISIFIEAWHRFRHPQVVDSFWMIIVALIALILNGSVTWWLHQDSGDDVNIRSAVIHTLGDAVSSAGILVAALLIRFTGRNIFDPMVSVLIGTMILLSSWGILRETVNLLLEGTPRGIDPGEVSREISTLPGILGVHHLHIWALGPSRPALSCHLQLGDISLKSAGETLSQVTAMLTERYGVAHTTIQLEYAGCDEDDPLCGAENRMDGRVRE